VRGAITGNDDQMRRVVGKVRDAAGGTLSDRIVTVLGLSFKANTGDRCDSPSVSISRMLVEEGATVHAFDPTVTTADAEDRDLTHLTIFDSPYDAAAGSHVIAILTEWQEFRWLDFAKVRQLVAQPAIVDARNLLDSGPLHRLGFSYSGIGRS
jgi:UDPglucose 6-dehydrogenase